MLTYIFFHVVSHISQFSLSVSHVFLHVHLDLFGISIILKNYAFINNGVKVKVAVTKSTTSQTLPQPP